VQALFLTTLKAMCEEGLPQLPFNCSSLNDAMLRADPTFHISNTPFEAFAEVVAAMVAEGHLETATRKESERQGDGLTDSLVVVRTKYDTGRPAAAAALACAQCGAQFFSRNKLFAHLGTAHGLASGGDGGAEGKVALVVAYLGTAYHGSARSDVADAVPTVGAAVNRAINPTLALINCILRLSEGRLWRAIGDALPALASEVAARRWAAHLATHVNPPGYTRSSRTDKGVHALGNVLACRLPSAAVATPEAAFCTAINQHLPDDVVVRRRLVVPMTFDARRPA
jgi:hypothetical protein